MEKIGFLHLTFHGRIIEWALMEPLPPGKKGDRGGTVKDNRLVLEVLLWLMRIGAPWRDNPEEFWGLEVDP